MLLFCLWKVTLKMCFVMNFRYTYRTNWKHTPVLLFIFATKTNTEKNEGHPLVIQDLRENQPEESILLALLENCSWMGPCLPVTFQWACRSTRVKQRIPMQNKPYLRVPREFPSWLRLAHLFKLFSIQLNKRKYNWKCNYLLIKTSH